MAIGLKMLKEGKVDGFVSAGSTGALHAASTLIVRKIKGVRRSAIATVLPFGDGILMLDCGANPTVTADILSQWAYIGSVYMKRLFGIENPRVGLLNNGTEEHKGSTLYKEAHALLKQAPIHFIGNIEGRDALLGGVDVVVCDGFSGNVLLKSIEGTAMFMGSLMKHKIFKRNILSMIGYLFCKKGVDDVMKMMDYREIGGTQFLGIKKPVIKAHGSSDALAFRNAVMQATGAAKSDFSAELEQALKALEEKQDD